MVKSGENICHRKDGHWECRYINGRSTNGKAVWEYAQGHGYHKTKGKSHCSNRKTELFVKQGKRWIRCRNSNGLV